VQEEKCGVQEETALYFLYWLVGLDVDATSVVNLCTIVP